MKYDISAVIPFRNRDPRRIAMAVESLRDAVGDRTCEILVLDCSSESFVREVEEYSLQSAAIFTHFQSNHWNKPKAMNRGIEAARGRWVLCADVDMIWEPQSIETALQTLEETPNACMAFQTRDLPPEATDQILSREAGDHLNWTALAESSSLHSRWGNGVLLFRRDHAMSIGGYDERLTVYGTEDLDFVSRLQRASIPFLWSNPSQSRLFHVWHEPLSKLQSKERWAARSLARNREIIQSDNSVLRNAVEGSVYGQPLVTVAIATRDRSQYLETAISSVLCQSVTSFEVIVVDDGSTDDTRNVVESFADSRIHYFYQQQAGISVARNLALAKAKGFFTAVMDDDDIMPPWRLEDSIAALKAGDHGTVGSFVSFNEHSGKLFSWADPLPTLGGMTTTGGFAGHPTWLIRTAILDAFRYDTSYSSSVDHNIAARMLRSGVQLSHSNRVFNLRRVHNGQVTNRDSSFQGRGARLDSRWVSSQLTPAESNAIAKSGRETAISLAPSKAEHDEIIPYLADHLVHRSLLVMTDSNDEMQWLRSTFNPEMGMEITTPDSHIGIAWVAGASWRQAATIAVRDHLKILKWHATPADQIGSNDNENTIDLIQLLWSQALTAIPGSSETTGQLRFKGHRYSITATDDETAVSRIELKFEESIS